MEEPLDAPGRSGGACGGLPSSDVGVAGETSSAAEPASHGQENAPGEPVGQELCMEANGCVGEHCKAPKGRERLSSLL